MLIQPLSPTIVSAAAEAGLKYVWQIEYADGSILNQYDENGTEHRLDFERVIRCARWIPLDPCLQSPSLVLEDGAKLCIFRRVFLSSDHGEKHICYGLGSEKQVAGRVQKRIWYITPSFEERVTFTLRCRGHEQHSESITLLFPGSFEESSDPEFVCFLQRWLTEILPEVRAKIIEEARAAHAAETAEVAPAG